MECEPSFVAQTIWERIKRRLDDWGLSWADLSRESGVPKPTFSRWRKHPEQNPDTRNLQRVAKALKMKIEELTGEAPMPESEHRPLGRLDAGERRIIEAIREDEDLEAAVLALVRRWTAAKNGAGH